MKNKKLSTEDFKKKVYALTGEEYTVLGEYKNNKTNILMRHEKCGNEYYVRPDSFHNGNRCPKCFGHTSDIDKFKKLVFNKYGDKYTVLGEYKNRRTPIKMKHNKCSTIFYATPDTILEKDSAGGCPKCHHSAPNTYANSIRKTTEKFKQEIFDLVGNEYSVIGEYKNNITPILFKHNNPNCKGEGEPFYMIPKNFLFKGCRCKYCQEARGEQIIKDFLNKNDIPYERQYTFPDLKNKKSLYFDFAIFDKNKKLILLIEFDGSQHFKTSKNWGGEERLKEQQLRDNLKNEYCLKNKIQLLRISYLKINKIEYILSNTFKELKMKNII